MDVSVALATFNGARFLEAQLASLLGQRLLPAELVVGDDGSTDGTVAILESFRSRAPFPVRIHRHAGLGWRENFIHTVGRCRMPLIALCDQDDLWHAEKIARCAAAFTDPSTMLVCHDAAILTSTGRHGTIRPTPSREVTTRLARAMIREAPSGLTMMFRREVAAYDDLWPMSVDRHALGERAAHDQWYFYLASCLGTIVRLPDVLVDYRQHDGNAVGARPVSVSSLNARRRRMVGDIHASEHQLQALIAVLSRAARRPGPHREALREAAARYGLLLDRVRARARIYRSRTPIGRLSAIMALRHAGGYRGDGWSFGLKALAIDLMAPALGPVETPEDREARHGTLD